MKSTNLKSTEPPPFSPQKSRLVPYNRTFNTSLTVSLSLSRLHFSCCLSAFNIYKNWLKLSRNSGKLITLPAYLSSLETCYYCKLITWPQNLQPYRQVVDSNAFFRWRSFLAGSVPSPNVRVFILTSIIHGFSNFQSRFGCVS